MATINERILTAKTTLFYVSSITNALLKKLQEGRQPNGRYSVVIHDKEHNQAYPYDKEAIRLTVSTFKRNNMKVELTRYKQTALTKTHGYIFSVEKI